jgi:sigma-B regulation protein RsbU (phosphoserine phosphatase)
MVLIRKLFDPAIKLLDQLRYPWKFLLISLCFVLPIILLIYMLFSEIGERIAFAEKERDGVAYSRALEAVRQTLYRMAIAQTPSEATDLSAAVKRLATAEQILGGQLDTHRQWRELNLLLSLPNQPGLIETALIKLERLNARVGNQSNLILDPDLDTYYLMDAVLLKLPDIGGIAADIGLLSAVTDSAERRNRLPVLLGRLKIVLEELSSNLEVAFAESLTQEVRHSLREPLSALRKAGNILLPLDGRPLSQPESTAASALLVPHHF